MEKTKVAIIGAGELGLALGKIVSPRAEILFWDKEPAKLMDLPGKDLPLPEIISQAKIIFLAIPSWGLKEALFCLSPYFLPKQTIITLSKGLEESSIKTAPEFVAKIANKCLLGHLSGPMLAEELSAGQLGWAVLASNNKKVFAVTDLFKDSKLIITTSTDLTGLSLAGVLKNIYALGAGIGEALNWGDNSRAVYLERAINEFLKIGVLLGGKKETFLGVAGLGDFLATALSRSSLNNELGRLIARGNDLAKKSEGSVSLPLIFRLLGNKAGDFPLLIMLKKVVLENQSAEEVYSQERYC